MTKKEKLKEQDEDGLLYWDEETQSWKTVCGNEIINS